LNVEIGKQYAVNGGTWLIPKDPKFGLSRALQPLGD
jgi:hypothetical protein